MGEAELKGLVRWYGEPLFVFDVLPDGRAWLQMYCLENINPPGEAPCEVVKNRVLTAASARQILTHLIDHKTIPLMLALHHTMDAGVPSGHFRPLRLQPSYYKDWRRKNKSGTMEQRRDRALREIGMYVRPPPPASSACQTRHSSSASYVPASSSTSDTAQTPPLTWLRLRHHSTESSVVAQPVVIDLVSSSNPSDKTDAAAPPEPTTVQIALSYSDTQAPREEGRHTEEPIVVPQRAKQPLTEAQLLLLDEHFKKNEPATPDATAALKKATSGNQHAYVEWKKNYKNLECFRAAQVSEIQDLYEACAKLQTEPVALVYLLRSLPYPQILFATVSDSVLVTLGRSLITLGRAQMLRRLQGSDVPADLQRVCKEWGSAIEHSDRPEARWVLAQEANRWSKLGRYRTYDIPLRVMPDIKVASWFHVVACILADTDALPPLFRHVPLAQ